MPFCMIRGECMNCTEFEKMIPEFLSQEMDLRTLKKFNEHMDTCKDCHEELAIQFLVAEGMQHLENGDAFDLQRELEIRQIEAENRVKYHSMFLYLGAALELIIISGVVGFVVWMLI